MRKNDLKWSEVTPRAAFLNRRQLMAAAGASALVGGLAGPALAKLDYTTTAYGKDLKPNTLDQITQYNNYYEFGFSKTDPAAYAGSLSIDPWSVEVGGMVEKPGTYALGDLIKGMPLEERIYRFRCVEAWSMVIPWVGFQLSHLLDRIGVQPSARYVAFETALKPKEMRNANWQGGAIPYVEGLRLDEAMNPLTIMATGLYGDPLPKQDGAPIRLVVPWKYGFKSIKAIVKITLTDKQPPNTWNLLQANEYGFYANVNPKVDHPRWSQATERLIGASVFSSRQPTLMFNGYGDEVAGLYAGMDLAKNF